MEVRQGKLVRKKKPEPEPEKPKHHKPDEMRHIERYTFPLLTHLMGLLPLDKAVAEKYLGWLDNDLDGMGPSIWPSSHGILGKLCNAGSDNHLYLLMACALWRDGLQGPWVGAWIDLLDFQSHGSCPWGEGFEELAWWGHSETHSTTYEAMRWEAALAVLHWTTEHMREAVPGNTPRFSVGDLNASCRRYLQAMAAFWSIGSEGPWEGLEGRSNARGELFDGSLLVPACGERSTMAHAYQSDLGSLLCHAVSLPQRSKRLSPEAAAIIGSVPQGYSAPEQIAGARNFTAAELLRNFGIRTKREIVYERWSEEVVMYCPGPRLDGNTPDVKYYYLNLTDHRIAIGFPWEGGRGDATKGIGGGCFRDPAGIFASGNQKDPLFLPLPTTPPLLKIVINQQGVTIS